MTKLSTSCPCGAVQICIADKPEFINDCDCSFCVPSGAIWGYYPTGDVDIHGTTVALTREDRSAPVVEIHSCATCKTTTHWQITKDHQTAHGPVDQMGVNMNLFERSDLAGVELRFPDGKNWNGEPEYGYRKEAVVFGKAML